MRLALSAAVLASLCAGPAFAQAFRLDDRPFAEAAGALMVTDRLRADCREASQPPLSTEIARWETTNRIPAFRAAVVEARKDATGDRIYQGLANGLEAKLSAVGPQACTYLKAWIASPNASLQASQPQVYAALGAPPARAAAPPATAARAAPAAAANASARPAAVSASAIHGYGLIQTYGMGYGGMITVKFTPAVLFRSGEILTDMDGLADPVADRRANPGHWSRWRQSAGTYEWAGESGKWHKILGNQVWTSAPATALTGRFVSVGGGGNLAVGGTTGIFLQSSYEFLPGGRVVREGTASASTEASGGGSTTRTTTASNSGRRPGRYAVQGLNLHITYDDGARETLTYMSHPKDPGIIWLNGTSYTRKG